ncbi:MAG TPA: hypothetical protein VM818_23395 [Vicinamibacterales bacterium]|nr:hypothetical protein [Vicinamibacterales bacterium]
MAATDDSYERSSVDDSLEALVARDFEPDVVRARGRLEERKTVAARRGRRALATGIAAGLGLILLALPWPRAAAQRMWDRLALTRVAVVDTARRDVPENVIATFTMEDRSPWMPEPVADLTEAERLAGFRPALPPPGVLKGTPELSVIRKVVLSTRPIRTTDIEQALASAGLADIRVPAEWEGVTLVAEGGPVVVATYDDGVEVMQSASFELNTPPGFPFGRFMEMAFRVFGRSAGEARILGQKLAENPALVLHFPEREQVVDVPLQSGQGVLVIDPDGSDGICFFWNMPDRIFIVSAGQMSQQQAATLANSIH